MKLSPLDNVVYVSNGDHDRAIEFLNCLADIWFIDDEFLLRVKWQKAAYAQGGAEG